MLQDEASRRYGSDLAGSVVEDPDVVLAKFEQKARQRAQNALVSIFLHADAVALADLLAGKPLADAEEAHAPFARVVSDAERALAEARESWKTSMMDLMRHYRPEHGPQVPTADKTAVDEAWQVLRDAQNEAEETGKHLRALQEKIKRLRAIPDADAADLAVLARALELGGPREGRSR